MQSLLDFIDLLRWGAVLSILGFLVGVGNLILLVQLYQRVPRVPAPPTHPAWDYPRARTGPPTS